VGSGGQGAKAGVYRIQNDRLWLYFQDGAVVYKSFYLNVRQGKLSKGIVYIDGDNFLLAD